MLQTQLRVSTTYWGTSLSLRFYIYEAGTISRPADLWVDVRVTYPDGDGRAPEAESAGWKFREHHVCSCYYPALTVNGLSGGK